MTDNRPRRVLFLIPSLRGGGAERVIVTLLRHLDRARFHLTLAVVDMRDEVFRSDVPSDIEIIDLRCTRVRSALPRVIGLVWNRHPDVVFSTLSHLNLALAIIKPLLPKRVRYIARESCMVSEVIHLYNNPGAWRWAYRRYYARFDRVICQSHAMQDDLVANFALPIAKAIVIHNPVDMQRIRQLSRESLDTGYEGNGKGLHSTTVQLVAAGRLTYQKGFDLLIKALAQCDNRRFRLTILGDGHLRDELEWLSQVLGLADRVRFVGFQKNPYPFFAQADAFVLSSRFEGLPNVVLEAIACGTPVIATPAPGGVTDILKTIPACHVAESVSSQALASAIRRWNDSMDVSIDAQAIAPFSIERVISQYWEALSSG